MPPVRRYICAAGRACPWNFERQLQVAAAPAAGPGRPSAASRRCGSTLIASESRMSLGAGGSSAIVAVRVARERADALPAVAVGRAPGCGDRPRRCRQRRSYEHVASIHSLLRLFEGPGTAQVCTGTGRSTPAVPGALPPFCQPSLPMTIGVYYSYRRWRAPRRGLASPSRPTPRVGPPSRVDAVRRRARTGRAAGVRATLGRRPRRAADRAGRPPGHAPQRRRVHRRTAREARDPRLFAALQPLALRRSGRDRADPRRRGRNRRRAHLAALERDRANAHGGRAGEPEPGGSPHAAAADLVPQ